MVTVITTLFFMDQVNEVSIFLQTREHRSGGSYATAECINTLALAVL